MTEGKRTVETGIIETALAIEEGLRVAIALTGERYGPATQLAGLCLAMKSIQADKFPEFTSVFRSVPKRALKEYQMLREKLSAAILLARSQGTLQ